MESGTLRIDKDGVWYFNDQQLERKELLNLYYSELVREGDEYFIKTSSEKVSVKVEDVPYIVISFFETEDGKFSVLLNNEQTIPLDRIHPLRVGQNGWLYVPVKEGMEAKFSRQSYFDVSSKLKYDRNGKLFLKSYGELFMLE